MANKFKNPDESHQIFQNICKKLWGIWEEIMSTNVPMNGLVLPNGFSFDDWAEEMKE